MKGRKQCRPKRVSSGLVVLNVWWSSIMGVSQEGDYCIKFFQLLFSVSSCASDCEPLSYFIRFLIIY